MSNQSVYLSHIHIVNLNPDYQAILTLHEKLKELNINHELQRLYDGWAIALLNKNGERIADVVEHWWSYGHEDDLMEAFGFPECGEDVIGYLNVEEALKLFIDNSKEKADKEEK